MAPLFKYGVRTPLLLAFDFEQPYDVNFRQVSMGHLSTISVKAMSFRYAPPINTE